MYAKLCHYYVIAFVFCTVHEQSGSGLPRDMKWSSECFSDPP